MMKNHASWLLISIHDCWEWEQIPVPNVQKLIGWAAIKSLMKPSWSANNGKLPSIADFWWLQLILCDAWCLLYSCIVTAKVDILHFSDCVFVNQLGTRSDLKKEKSIASKQEKCICTMAQCWGRRSRWKDQIKGARLLHRSCLDREVRLLLCSLLWII